MDDEAHVGLVDAHAERHGGADDGDLVAGERLLRARARRGLHPGVVRGSGSAARAEPLGEALACLAALRIHDAALAAAPLDEREELAERVDLGVDPVEQVGPVEAGDVDARIAEAQRDRDVGAHLLRGGRREGHDRRLREDLAQVGEAAVLGPEVVPPLADAVGLVHGDGAHVEAAQLGQEARRHQALGRDVEQPVAPLAETAQAAPGVVRVERRVEEGGGDARDVEGVDLILHQGDERRDHHREARAHHRGELEAEALPAARGQEGHHVAPGERVRDDLGLERPEGVEAEVLLEDLEQGCGVGDHDGRRL